MSDGVDPSAAHGRRVHDLQKLERETRVALEEFLEVAIRVVGILHGIQKAEDIHRSDRRLTRGDQLGIPEEAPLKELESSLATLLPHGEGVDMRGNRAATARAYCARRRLQLGAGRLPRVDFRVGRQFQQRSSIGAESIDGDRISNGCELVAGIYQIRVSAQPGRDLQNDALEREQLGDPLSQHILADGDEGPRAIADLLQSGL